MVKKKKDEKNNDKDKGEEAGALKPADDSSTVVVPPDTLGAFGLGLNSLSSVGVPLNTLGAFGLGLDTVSREQELNDEISRLRKDNIKLLEEITEKKKAEREKGKEIGELQKTRSNLKKMLKS